MVHIVENLSNKIWQAKLANAMELVNYLIADKAHFVHMGITLDKEGELEAFHSRKFERHQLRNCHFHCQKYWHKPHH